jgi:cold-inducible RNA-binding protein
MTIYVGNISYKTNEDGLTALFSQFGTVTSAKIIRDKYKGRSKGYGFVEMETEADVENAVNALNGKDLDGRNLKVNKALPRKEY